MPLDLAALLVLAPVCAPSVAPATLLAVVQVESGFDPLAIGVNGVRPRRMSFASASAAAEAARALIAVGENIDLGLGQINVRNLPRLGLTVSEAFDPCRNLAAAGRILTEGYQRALLSQGVGQPALRSALSLYNTGHPERGFRNGYVARVLAKAGHAPPVLASPQTDGSPSAPPLAEWDVFGRARLMSAELIIRPSHGAQP